jgi:hypothetical protein
MLRSRTSEPNKMSAMEFDARHSFNGTDVSLDLDLLCCPRLLLQLPRTLANQ